MKRALFGSIMTVITIVAAVIGLINYITNANTTYFSGLGKDPVVIGCAVLAIAALALWLVLGEPKASWKDILPVIAPACLLEGHPPGHSSRVPHRGGPDAGQQQDQRHCCDHDLREQRTEYG